MQAVTSLKLNGLKKLEEEKASVYSLLNASGFWTIPSSLSPYGFCSGSNAGRALEFEQPPGICSALHHSFNTSWLIPSLDRRLQPGIKVQKSCQSAREGRARELVSTGTELQTAL